MRTDTTMANEALKGYFESDEVYVPLNFANASLPGYIMYANDNKDINEATLDGIGTFHASQTAAFRRSKPSEEIPKIKLKSERSKSVSVPPGLFELRDAKMGSQKPPPKFHASISPEMYDADTEININITKQSKSRDLAWIICRLQNTDNQVVPSWSGFNHLVTKSNNPKTVAGLMLIINSPAHRL